MLHVALQSCATDCISILLELEPDEPDTAEIAFLECLFNSMPRAFT